MRRTGRNAIFTTLILTACGGEAPANQPVTFFEEVAVDPVAVTVLRSDREEREDGLAARTDVDVLLPAMIDQPTARATLQHMIDSIAAGDSTIAAIRISGFMVGRLDPLLAEADVDPAVIAVWQPVDTLAFDVRTPQTRFRTRFTILTRLPRRESTQ